jgi:hypothetical protein
MLTFFHTNALPLRGANGSSCLSRTVDSARERSPDLDLDLVELFVNFSLESSNSDMAAAAVPS